MNRKKMYGFQSRTDRDGKVVCLRACTNETCDKIETNEKEFKSCPRCLTVYCSTQCNELDAKAHLEFCRSKKSYESQLECWNEKFVKKHYPESVKNPLFSVSTPYLYMWGRWMLTPRIKQLIQFLALDVDQLVPVAHTCNITRPVSSSSVSSSSSASTAEAPVQQEMSIVSVGLKQLRYDEQSIQSFRLGDGQFMKEYLQQKQEEQRLDQEEQQKKKRAQQRAKRNRSGMRQKKRKRKTKRNEEKDQGEQDEEKNVWNNVMSALDLSVGSQEKTCRVCLMKRELCFDSVYPSIHYQYSTQDQKSQEVEAVENEAVDVTNQFIQQTLVKLAKDLHITSNELDTVSQGFS